MSIFNKRIFPDQQFADRDGGQPPVQSGPRAPASSDVAGADYPSYGQATGGSEMAPDKVWLPQADIVPPEDAGARQFVPYWARVPSSPPPRLPRIEPPADNIQTYLETDDRDLYKQLAFPAHCVIVDNYSAQWLYIDAARRFCPPWTTGQIVPLPQATEVAQYEIRRPPTIVAVGVDATQLIGTAWCAAMLPASSGTAIAIHP